MKQRVLVLSALLAAAVCSRSGAATILTNDTLIDVGNGAYDGQDLVINKCTVTINGPHGFKSLAATNGAVLTHSPASAGQPDYRISLTITQGVTLDTSSRIDVTGRGYASASGPGAGFSSASSGGAGAGHAGLGGVGTAGGSGGTAYGSILAPVQPGSGGGNGLFSFGGSGGGVIQLAIGGTLRLDGLITAGGGAGSYGVYGGGGSGGSISITASNLTGYGAIRSDGGVATGGNGGGGGGGRIALQLSTNQFSGSLSAYGAGGSQYGGAGTVFVKAGAGSPGDVRVDNGGNGGQFTPLTSPQPVGLTIANRAAVYPVTELTNTTVTLKSNGLLTQLAGQPGLSLTVINDLVIESGGRLDVSSLGYAAGAGPGAGAASVSSGGGGGGHGGSGGTAAGGGGGAYDSIPFPSQAGSGGGAGFASSAGPGGGVIRLMVGGTLQVDGVLAADGGDSYNYINGGAGAGGSLWLTVGTLRGGGWVTADGGVNGGNGGGGAGGRIAIYYQSNAFTGVLSAYGGAGAARGGAGTIFSKAASASHGSVLVHNGGNAGGLTRLNTGFWPVGEYYDLTIAGAARLVPEVPMAFWNIVLSSAAVITHDLGQTGFQLTTVGDFRLDPGTAINVNACGYASAVGPGAGGSATTKGGGGGGYGGVGGSWTNTAAGGVTYGSQEEPTHLGSGGGAGYLSRGGFGGGAIRLTVGGILQLNGTLTADGGPGLDYDYGGGGSGGSIYVSADVLTGAGSITANGGSSTLAGGGGGGRIALYPRLIVGFTNVPSGAGGAGGNSNLTGRASSVYYASNVAPLKVVSATPTGTIMRPIGGVDVLFSAAVNPSTFTAADVAVTSPTGAVSQSQIVVTPLAGPLFNVSFPLQTNLGLYRIRVGPHIQDLAGRELDQNNDRVPGQDPGDVFTNTLTLVRPVVSGAITAENGWPVRGVTVRASDNSATTTTDTNGLYSLSLPPGFTGNVVPSLTGGLFAPASRSYAALDANQTAQNFALANDLHPTLVITLVNTNARVTWPSLPAFKYQLKASDALASWLDLGAVTNGTGLPILRDVPMTPTKTNRFFRVQVLLN